MKGYLYEVEDAQSRDFQEQKGISENVTENQILEKITYKSNVLCIGKKQAINLLRGAKLSENAEYFHGLLIYRACTSLPLDLMVCRFDKEDFEKIKQAVLT